MEYAIFLLLGIGVGTFGTLVGIGGGLILVPFFIFFMSAGCIYPYFHEASQIVGTSLFVVFTNALSGTIAYIRQRRVFYHAAVPFALATLPGAFLGSYAADRFTDESLDFYYGCFLLCMASLMYWNNTRKNGSNTAMEIAPGFKYNRPLGIVCSGGVGFIASMFGIGGGIIHVPLMVYVLGFPAHIATATSQFVLAVSSLVGLISHTILGHVVWLPAICIGIGAALGAQLGAKISKQTKPRTILLLLSFAVFIVAVRLIYMGM